MRRLKKKSAIRSPVPRARKSHSRQRQLLIDACISALHLYGPSRTTVEKVVAIAKMSPGIVRFYFASKAAMLVASLQFLATEFEEQLLVPVTRLKSRPVAALELMVDLYLDPEIASPRKVSVWYAFWGEASSRQEYYDICGQMDERFAALVRELIGALIIETGQPQLDSGGIALGLMGSLEMLWQDFAFRNEADINRATAKRRCMAYLGSVFPGQFAAAETAAGLPGSAFVARRLPAWSYDNARLFALERERIFQNAWQFVGLCGQLALPGDYLAADLQIERPLVLRDSTGELRALRNSCTEAPHILTQSSSGHLSEINCSVHGLRFELDGRRRDGHGVELTALELRLSGELILVRAASRAAGGGLEDPWRDAAVPSGSRLLMPPLETPIAADWKLVVEQCLGSAAAARSRSGGGWSARSYRRLLGSSVDIDWGLQWVAPNHLIESRPDGFTILQVLPRAPGFCVLRSHHYTLCAADRAAAAVQYLASRLRPQTRRLEIGVAESTQKGLAVFGNQAAQGVVSTPELLAFQQFLVARVPAMASARPSE